MVRSVIFCVGLHLLMTPCSDRTLPSCLLCGKSSQSCVYPPRKLKPGPKVGQSSLAVSNFSLSDRFQACHRKAANEVVFMVQRVRTCAIPVRVR
jgi:hypothetical protein